MLTMLGEFSVPFSQSDGPHCTLCYSGSVLQQINFDIKKKTKKNEVPFQVSRLYFNFSSFHYTKELSGSPFNA